MEDQTEALERILLVRNDQVGDLVLTLPAMEAVRLSWPRAHITALVSAYTSPLLHRSPYVNEVLVDDPAESPWRLARKLRPMHFDAALVFNTNSRNCLAVWRAGVGRRVFWAYKPAGFLLGNRRVKLHRNRPAVHEAEFALAFVRRLGVQVDLASLSPRLEIDQVIRQRVAARICSDLGEDGPLFGVHPGCGHSAYNWPPSNYIQLVRELSRHARVMVTGSPSERPLLARIRAGLDNESRGRVAFYSDFELPELAAAIAEQTALTACSTGPMHLAGILATPVVALFSPHPAHAHQKWAPLGTGHTLLVAPLEADEDRQVPSHQATPVMSRIRVPQVVEANLRYARWATDKRHKAA